MKILTIILFLILVPFTTANSAHPNCPIVYPMMYGCTYNDTINLANYKGCSTFAARGGVIVCDNENIGLLCGVFKDKAEVKAGQWVQQKKDKNIYICIPQ